MIILVDSNVLLDIFTNDSKWFDWSSQTLSRCAEGHTLAINPIIYAEVSLHFSAIEALNEALLETDFRRLPLSWEAGFLAGRCFIQYRKQSGQKRSPLPDFYIGAHALLCDLTLLTRDTPRYKTYFPQLRLICPED